jgi:hypothetical protein
MFGPKFPGESMVGLTLDSSPGQLAFQRAFRQEIAGWRGFLLLRETRDFHNACP